MYWLLLPLLLGSAAVLGAVAWSAVSSWFSEQKSQNPQANVGALIRTSFARNDVSYVSGVFDQRGRQLASQTWRASSLDNDLERQLQGRSRMTVAL